MYEYLAFCFLISISLSKAFLNNRVHFRHSLQRQSSLTDDAVFYPKPAKSLEGLSEEEVLYDLFLRQFMDSEDEAKPFSDSDQATRLPNSFVNKDTIISRKVIELPASVVPDMPLEIVYKNRIAFANFVERKVGKKGLGSGILVRLVSGEVVTIDIGQIVSCWDQLADEGVPSTPASWAQVTGDALEILGNMSPRKSDLQEFWQIVLQQRSNHISVDSLDLGVYIFQERSFRKWVNPYADASDSNVRALSASQRYAAALLLYNDDFHFKRKQSTIGEEILDDKEEEESIEVVEEVLVSGDKSTRDKSTREKALTGYSVEDIMHDRRNSAAERNLVKLPAKDEVVALQIIEGAYKVLDEGISMFREGEVFEQYYESKKLEMSNKGNAAPLASSPFRAGCITRQLRALEIYSMSPKKFDPPSAVKHILKRLNKTLDPGGAKKIIMDINYNPSKSIAATAVNAMRLKRPARFDDQESSDESNGNSLYDSVTPWTEEVYDAALNLAEEVDKRRKDLDESRPGTAGKKGPSGLIDYRGNSADHPVLCVDGKKATFLDDAFSISPETGEVLVHIVDVVGTLRRHELLQQTARERISSTYLPSGSLHMLPPQALESLKLSTKGPNEVMTVALSIDSTTGSVLGFRIFPSLIGPVFSLDVETADEIMEGVGYKKGSPAGQEVSSIAGVPDAVVRDLLTVRRLMDRVIEKQPWVDVHYGKINNKQFKLNKKTDTYEQSTAEKTPASRMVNSLLTLFSNSSVTYCASKGVDVPVAWENRDRVDTSMVRRFGTQPLRNWISQLQQKQLRAALRMELPLSRKECAMAVSHHNSKRKQTNPLMIQGTKHMSFESFESHCSNLLASGENIVFLAEGTGRGGTVRIKDFQVDGVLSKTIEKGEKVRVRVKKINPENKTVILELAEV